MAWIQKYEGWRKFHEKFCEELADLPSSERNKKIVSAMVSPKDIPNWTLSIAEADAALRLSRSERINNLTYEYVSTLEEEEQPVPRKRSKKQKLSKK